MSHPIIIQGGMGAGVSNWRLARSVSICGQMGVVSGTALDVILARRLQEGDLGGDLRRALNQFPIPGMAQRAETLFCSRRQGTVATLQGCSTPVASTRPGVDRACCDLGYLRRTYRKADGTLGYRCPGEPEEQFVSKGGRLAEAQGRKCVCNGLLSTIGLGQIQADEYHEPALVTAGDDVKALARFLRPEQETYSAADVIRHLLS